MGIVNCTHSWGHVMYFNTFLQCGLVKIWLTSPYLFPFQPFLIYGYHCPAFNLGFLSAYICVPYEYLIQEKASRWHNVPWNWKYRWLVLGTELRSLASMVSSHNYRVISPALYFRFYWQHLVIVAVFLMPCPRPIWCSCLHSCLYILGLYRVMSAWIL